MTSIEDYAFWGCSYITFVSLPASITNIGNNALPRNEVRISPNYTTITQYSVSTGSYAQLWVLNKEYAATSQSLVKSYVTTPTSVDFTFYPIKENVNVSSFKVNEIPVDLNNYTLKMSNLNPGTEFEITLEIIANGRTFKFKDMYRTSSNYVGYTKYKTDALILTTLSPKVTKQGEAIVAAESNLDDEETNVGFEWRRTDWPDDFASNTGTAYLYEGIMEGYIRNLNTDKLWRYRPYFLSASGRYYYGDWVGLDPTNTSYFEPTVHTYEQVEIDGNTALVKGYAMTGTDGVTVQGFMYWKSVADAQSADATNRAVAIPSDAKTVEASGQVMTANLTGLDYNSTYHYVAFVKTTMGETFYGEERMFDTEADPTGISEVVMDKPNTLDMVQKGIYTLSGMKVADDISELYSLPYGVYIVNGKKYNRSRNSRP